MLWLVLSHLFHSVSPLPKFQPQLRIPICASVSRSVGPG